jgi:uncharacterized membrane protein YgaE (UPF0421/DUF939 family)
VLPINEGTLTGLQRFGSSLSEAVRGARRRVAEAGWSVVQTPVAAGLAWYIAHTLLGHHQPFFAPTAAAVSLSKNRVLRGQRALQLIVGVVLGIGIGTAVKAVAGSTPSGSGAIAIGAAAAIALLAALAVGGGFFARGVLFVNQSATSAILMIAVAGTATGPERLSDALIGGGVTLVITVVLFPAAPLPLIQDAVQQVFGVLRDTLGRLAELAGTGGTADPGWALAVGERIQAKLAGLQQAKSAAGQVASLAPRRWPERSRVRRACEQTASLQLLTATVLSLAHASIVGPDPKVPNSSYSPAVREALGELTSAFAALAEGGDARATQATRHAIRVRVLMTGAVRTSDPHPQLIATLVETCGDDTLRFTGKTRNGMPLSGRLVRCGECGTAPAWG